MKLLKQIESGNRREQKAYENRQCYESELAAFNADESESFTPLNADDPEPLPNRSVKFHLPI